MRTSAIWTEYKQFATSWVEPTVATHRWVVLIAADRLRLIAPWWQFWLHLKIRDQLPPHKAICAEVVRGQPRVQLIMVGLRQKINKSMHSWGNHQFSFSRRKEVPSCFYSTVTEPLNTYAASNSSATQSDFTLVAKTRNYWFVIFFPV